ncbi:hypothetical protein NP493_1111g00004 [Ridgeia piscesae]|uniref:Lipid-binding serum glycoprotein N-terminal domain-containing protein n=1 Tax=Ridgeia piscesae TaxID=27915 RepID=A0AAD9KHU1_RIDPI|nr:hypothetical protein NP493_1111g00004 [Ridgeia piscesae]
MAVLVVLLLAVILSVCGASTVPGVKIRFSRRGLDFVSNAAQDVLLTELTNGSIVDQHFKSGKSKYDITGVQITSFKKPSAVTTVAPGRGITWTLSGGAISMKGNWYYKYHQNWLFQISYAGTFDISATGFEISLSIILGMDNAGQPTVQTTGCSSDVRTLTVHLHGDHAKFFEVFDQQVAQRMKTQLKTKLCEAAQKAIRKNGAKRMKRLNLQVNFAKWLVMDDRLVQAPKFTSSYFESFHKGEVFGHNYIEAPFQPQPLRDEPIGGARMMTIWISEYVLNTLGYVVQTHDLIQFKLSNKELAKKGKPNLLDTTCTGNVCIGSFLPGISKRFPNSSVSVHLASTGETDRPRFTMLPGKLQLLLVGMAYFSVKTPNGTEVHLEKARIVRSLSVTISQDLR